MFTGIIKEITTIEDSKTVNGSLFLTIKKPPDWKIQEGDSICTNGVCLTVKTIQDTTYTTELMDETLKKTTYGFSVPERVNIEQSLRMGDSLDGHLVFGHVDTVGEIIEITPVDESRIYRFSFPKEFSYLLAPKGSVAVDGISLTVVEVGKNWFTVSLVDYTIQHTTLGKKVVGEKVNLEFDMLAKYVARMINQSK